MSPGGERMTAQATETGASSRLSPYVPRLVVDWLRHTPDLTYREVDGSLAFLDISGFTRLTERLARRGQEGAEEMSDILNSTFSQLLDVGYQDGAGLVKWGGDAVLLLFDGPDHASRAARATFRMREQMRAIGRLTTSAGSVVLRMSAGLHSGTFHFFLVGDPARHRELLVAGPAASTTAEMESVAAAGEIAMSAATAGLLPASAVGRASGSSFLLRAAPDIDAVGVPPAKSVAGLNLFSVLPAGIREHLTEQPGEAEHRTISVGFVQFSGTDALLTKSGPAAVADALQEVIVNIQNATDHYGVTFFETDINRDGGKVMLTAGAPTSHGNDEDRMLRAARQIIESAGRLPLRVGVNRGAVFSGDFGPPFRKTYSVKGDAVNLAARVMARAQVGELLATNDIVERRRTDFALTALPPFTVKGKRRPVEAFVVGAVRSGDEHVDEAQPLIGRESEMTALRSPVSRAIAGQGSLTMVTGDRGSGRTRIAAELIGNVDGATVIATTCDEYDATTPYLTMRRLFRRALGSEAQAEDADVLRRVEEVTSGELGLWLPLIAVVLGVDVPSTPEVDELEDEFRKPRMEWAVLELLQHLLPGPSVLLFDDVHHLDDASRSLLDGMVGLARGKQPWAVVVTTPTEAAGLAPEPDIVVDLLPLRAEDAAELVAAETRDHPLTPGVVATIVSRSAGNPLFLHSLVMSARTGADIESLPETIEGLVTVEIDRLPPTHRRILRYAAVLGTTVDHDLLARMLEENWIDPASPRFDPLRGFLTIGRRGQLQFRTALMRDVAYQGLPFRRRRSLHEQAGAALLDQAAKGELPVERLARHFHLADRAPEAWQYSKLAAERAHQQFAHAEVVRFLRWAVVAAPRLDIPATERAEVVEQLGDAQFLLGLSSDARSSYLRAAREFAVQPTRAAAVHLKLARLDQRVGHLSQSLRRLSRGMALVSDLDAPRAKAVQAELMTRYAIGRFQQGRYREAKRWGDQAVVTAEHSEDQEVLANAHNALEAITLWSGIASDVSHGEIALALYEELADLAGQGHSLNNLAIRAIFEGRWDDTQRLLSRAADLFEQIGDVASLAAALYNQADVLVRQGRSVDAEPLLERSLRIARSVDDDETVALVLRDWGKSRARAGRFDEARSLLAQAMTMLDDLGEPQELLDAQAALAECDLLEGKPVDALDVTERALKSADDENASVLPTLYRVRGFALLTTGDLDGALSNFDAGLALQSPAARHEMAFLSLGRAEVARRQGDPRAQALQSEGDAAMRALGVVAPPIPTWTT
jgi:class 3 adenylate cyclase/tetratricopeptide (TPR) repeat protein